MKYILFVFFFLSFIAFGYGQQKNVPTDKKILTDTVKEAPEALQSLIDQLERLKDEDQGRNAMDIEIDGLIVDETITKIGKDFYDFFYAVWEAPRNGTGYSIVIKERALPRLGTLISIDVNDNRIFEQAIPPRYDIIEAYAQFAASLAYDYLVNYEEIQRQLEGDDMKGSGIF